MGRGELYVPFRTGLFGNVLVSAPRPAESLPGNQYLLEIETSPMRVEMCIEQ